MNAVLYTHQLEPITVVDIPMWAWERLWNGDHIRLDVMVPFKPWDDREPTDTAPTVTIVGERIARGKHRSLMLFTKDEEHALMMKADFLPGQRSEVQERQRIAFARGMLDALRRMGP